MSRVKCLIVDDLEENLLALSALLQNDDVELLKAHSGSAALELLLVHDIALAFVDVQMPEMDGFELAELMRGSERSSHVPIIFVTAGVRDQHRIFKGYETGAVDFLYKPIEPHILKSKADVFFQLYRQKQQLAHELHERTETLRLNEMFTAVLGHDLRNPLNALTMSSQLLQRNPGEAVVQNTAGRMLSSCKRMSRMIEDMLDLARARLAGGITLRRERIYLVPLVQRVVQEHRTAFPDKRIDLLHEGDLNGEWDADRLAQVVSNLVGNAMQHGKQGEAVTAQLDGNHTEYIQLAVINAGAIPDDILPHIFDPFRGSERNAGHKEGLGLGLYIVQQIVHAHQGSIVVDCGSGQQTIFRVTIPREISQVVKL